MRLKHLCFFGLAIPTSCLAEEPVTRNIYFVVDTSPDTGPVEVVTAIPLGKQDSLTLRIDPQVPADIRDWMKHSATHDESRSESSAMYLVVAGDVIRTALYCERGVFARSVYGIQITPDPTDLLKKSPQSDVEYVFLFLEVLRRIPRSHARFEELLTIAEAALRQSRYAWIAVEFPATPTIVDIIPTNDIYDLEGVPHSDVH
jgi:hypothetical protein